VVTLFERMTPDELPFYLHLMLHLASRDICVPSPVADVKGHILHRLKDKPAAVVRRLGGGSEMAPQPLHCAQVGGMLAQMHLAGGNYPRRQANPRGLAWGEKTIPALLPHLSCDQRILLEAELAFQRKVAATAEYGALPRGPIHADLFRDNVLFQCGRLSGFLDFYFAGCDAFLFDVAVCLNDWCVEAVDGRVNAGRRMSFLEAYECVRPLTVAERNLLATFERAAALRFWVSRLSDRHSPRTAAVLKPHDPRHFERILRQRAADAVHCEIPENIL
jgi:homoserine kinase type II